MVLDVLRMAAGGTGFIFLMTCLGSAMVFFFRNKQSGATESVFLGFAAGVMIAASVWSLLIPAIDQVEGEGGIGWIPAALGFLAGCAFLFALDNFVPHLHPSTNTREGVASEAKRSTLLVAAVTLHNIPEGMAVGLAFALAAQNAQGGQAAGLAAAAWALAIGIGIQNFPEGAAISLPLCQEGVPARKAFLMGCGSGAVEPVFGILIAVIATVAAPQVVMPWLLSFAAGAMIYVVVEELIPEAHMDSHSSLGTLGVIGGFLIMMILDVALG